MKMRQTNLILLALFCIVACEQQKGIFTDSRDGKEYKTVKIGKQVWMAENLNYNASGSKCYNNEEENCKKYGRLYNWEMAMKACPKGWHLPSNTEWSKLYLFADGEKSTQIRYASKTAGEYLLAKSGWPVQDGVSFNGEDKFGFSALPGGIGHSGDWRLSLRLPWDSPVLFGYVGYFSYWWSSSPSEYNGNNAYSQGMSAGAAYYEITDKSFLCSVRCLRD